MHPIRLIISTAVGISLLAACASPTPTAVPTKPAAAATAISAPATTVAAPATTIPATAPPSQPAASPAAGNPAAPSPATSNPTVAPPSTSAGPAAPTKPAASPATTSASPAAAPAAAADARTFKLLPDQNEAGYTVQETFANVPGLIDAVGTTRGVTGQIVITKDLKIAEGSKITIDLTTLKSDRSQRDGFIQRTTFKNAPTAVFVPKEFRGLASPAPTSGPFKGQLVGDLTIGTVTKPVTFDFDGTIEGNTVKGKATSAIKITDLGLELPRAPIILSVEDLAKLHISFTAAA